MFVMTVLILAQLICGCSSKTEQQKATTTPEETPTSSIVIRTKESPPHWITRTPEPSLKRPEIDRIKQKIENGIENSVDFGDERPVLKEVELRKDELYVEYLTEKLADIDVFIEMQKVAAITEDSFAEYQKPKRVTIRVIPNKAYKYETNLMWEEFIKLASNKMPNSEWSKATSRSK
ncbi:MAG TPA: hypothetical protein EYP30_05710 [Archaeoglobaceae archaeon]|nr:hypothetical protein [Archaeoglobaceae archaeon]